MINTNETLAPEQFGSKLNTSETVPPGSGASTGPAIILSPGESVADSFVIHSQLSNKGRQSDVYLAKRWGKNYVVKLYRNGWSPSAKMQSFLKNADHPNIARIIEFGEYSGQYYEIYEYYSEGTLEETGAVTSAHIQSVIVPSINEGLHELHRNSIIHCDIKPGNLFYTDNGERVVIGDCGISGYTNTSGKLVDSMRGTPEYAPRVRSLMWSAAMSPAYDYGSFGLVLCRMALGRSLFSGMSLEEIARAWENGITLPSAINGRLATLIKGLINENESERWGYNEVKRWCEGEFMRSVPRSLYGQSKKTTEIKPLIFGRFGNEMLTVSTLHQLSVAVSEHWEQATRVIKRRELAEFVGQFNKDLKENVRKLALSTDPDTAVFRLLMLIDGENERISFCGKNYDDLAGLIDSFSTGRDEVAKKFISSGMLVLYLREQGAERRQVDKLEELINRSDCNDMAAISTICFSLQGMKSITVFGKKVSSLQDMASAIAGQGIGDICSLLESEQFAAWMYCIGYDKEYRKMKEL